MYLKNRIELMEKINDKINEVNSNLNQAFSNKNKISKRERSNFEMPVVFIIINDKVYSQEDLAKGSFNKETVYDNNPTNDTEKEYEEVVEVEDMVYVEDEIEDSVYEEDVIYEEEDIESEDINVDIEVHVEVPEEIIVETQEETIVEDNNTNTNTVDMDNILLRMTNKILSPSKIMVDNVNDNPMDVNYNRIRMVEKSKYPKSTYLDDFKVNPYQAILEYNNGEYDKNIYMDTVKRFRCDKLSGGDFRLINYFNIQEDFYISKDINTMNEFDDILVGIEPLIDDIRVIERRPNLRFKLYSYTSNNDFRLVSIPDSEGGVIQIAVYLSNIYVFYSDEEINKPNDVSWGIDQYSTVGCFYSDFFNDLNIK